MPRLRVLGGLLLALVLITPASAQLPPEKAAATFKVSDGLEFTLWASEPLFVNPTCMDVDHLGRVWVCESVNYRNKLRNFKKLTREKGDRIVILEDSKGTGKADKETTFYQHPDIMAPLGIAVLKDPAGKGWKVYVCQSPDILVLQDKDGDGVADGPPKKLLTNFRGIDHDHGVHSILVGPDMKLYFTVGDSGVGGLTSSDGKGRKWSSNSTDCRAGTVWRCDQDGKNLELIAHNFRNNYECCVDSFGTVFLSDNDDDGNQQTRICHVIPGGDYGYHPRGPGQTHWHEEQPGVVHKILRTYFGSPTGICVYEGKLLPKKYHGQLLHTDAGPRHVRAYHLTPKGASYVALQEDIVESKDNWFRPSDVCVAPDGSVFVADWYDPGVGGHGMGDITRGRVYRLAPKGDKSKTPKVDLSKPEGVRAALGSPNLATRYMAMAHIDAMKNDDENELTSKEILELLRPAFKQSEDRPLRARAIWQLARAAKRNEAWKKHFKDKTGKMLTSLLALVTPDEDPDFKLLHLRIAKDVFGYSPAERPSDEFREGIVANKSAAVHREALVLMRDAPVKDAKYGIYELMKKYDGKDRFYLSSIGIAVGQHDEKRREAILGDFSKHFPEFDDKVADLIWELRPPGVAPLLEKKLTDDKTPASAKARIIDILAASSDKGAGEALITLLASDQPAEVRDRVLENLRLHLPGKWKDLGKSDSLNKAIDSLMAKPTTRVAGIGLIGVAGRGDRVKDVVRFATSKDESAQVRKSAVVALGQIHNPAAVTALTELLGNGQADLRGDVAKALGDVAKAEKSQPGVAALKALQGVVGDDKADANLRESAVVALSAGRPGTIWLIELQTKGKLDAKLIDTAARFVRSSPYRDLQNKALVAFPPPGRLDPKKLPSLASLVARKGDVAKGKQLFADTAVKTSQLACMKCHTVRGQGGQIGPDLSMIGKKASRENLFESILYPDKAVADQFATWTVETDKGELISGLIVEDTKEVVVLRDLEGRDTRIPAKRVEKRTKSTKSLMPDDLLVHMTEDQLVDMVEYLFTLKTPALAIDRWHIAGPFDNGTGMEGLDKVYPPEKGIDLKATYEGKGEKVTWKEVKPGNNGYVDLMAHFAPNSGNIVSYLTCEIESPADLDATILMGTDDGAKLWLNDKLVHTSKLTRSAAPEQDSVSVKLKKGSNRVVLKINNGDGPHGFYFTVVAEQELKVKK